MRRSLPTASLAALVLLGSASAARVQPYSMYSPYPPARSHDQAYQPYQPPPPSSADDVGPPPNAPRAEPSPSAPNQPAKPSPAAGTLQTPSAYGHSNVEHAVEAPLHDLNITGQRIPDVLLLAMADPYATLPSPSCREINMQIAVLTAALGPDFGEPGTTEDPSIHGKVRPTALALMHSAAESVLPFNSYVSTLSGAQRRDALVNKAINAGGIRRGYLKGLGESQGCQPPAAPQHLLYPAPPLNDHSRPIYAIH